MSYINITFTNRFTQPAAQSQTRGFDFGISREAVSYTHLTLPTNREV